MEIGGQHHAPAALHLGKNLGEGGGSTAGFEKSEMSYRYQDWNPEPSALSQYVGKMQIF